VPTWLEQHGSLLVRANHTLFDLDAHKVNTFSVKNTGKVVTILIHVSHVIADHHFYGTMNWY